MASMRRHREAGLAEAGQPRAGTCPACPEAPQDPRPGPPCICLVSRRKVGAAPAARRGPRGDRGACPAAATEERHRSPVLTREGGQGMIWRHWKGIARPGHAQAYVDHLKSETSPRLASMPGFVRATILQRPVEGIEFQIVTV